MQIGSGVPAVGAHSLHHLIARRDHPVPHPHNRDRCCFGAVIEAADDLLKFLDDDNHYTLALADVTEPFMREGGVPQCPGSAYCRCAALTPAETGLREALAIIASEPGETLLDDEAWDAIRAVVPDRKSDAPRDIIEALTGMDWEQR